ncbi:MAG: hypothetical protein SFX74_07615 [Fimbriimonadaceae bacterium]|nr:hypothetical protein [Fimbriimonadaceae bacterium]
MLLAFTTLMLPNETGGPQSGFRASVAPPEFAVERGAITSGEVGYLLAFHVFNRGQSDALDVVVMASIGDQISSTKLDRVPAQGSAHGYLHFKKVPPGVEPRIDVERYRLPPIVR